MVLCWWLFSGHVRRLWTSVASIQHCVWVMQSITCHDLLKLVVWVLGRDDNDNWQGRVCDVREGVVEMVVLASLWLCACDYVEGWGALTLVCTALIWAYVFVQHWCECMYLWFNPWPKWYQHLHVVCILNTHMENPLMFGPTGDNYVCTCV